VTPDELSRASASAANWEPYFPAETPDVIEKRLRHLALFPTSARSADTSPHPAHSVLDDCFAKGWKYECKARTMLEVVVCQLRTFQIRMFLNTVNSPIHDVLEM
jgi:hypothetical protein